MCIRESVERLDANVVCCWSTIRRSVLHAHIATTTVSTINNHLHSHKENAKQQRRSASCFTLARADGTKPLVLLSAPLSQGYEWTALHHLLSAVVANYIGYMHVQGKGIGFWYESPF
jgi:hypothetical protein